MRIYSHDKLNLIFFQSKHGDSYYRGILAFACGIPAVLGMVVLATLVCSKKLSRPINENINSDA